MQTLESVYRQCFPLIRAKCRRMLLDVEEAQDVAQETFIRFWRTAEAQSLGPEQKVAWLYRTSTRLAVDRIRQKRPAEKHRAIASDAVAESAAGATETRQLLSQLASQIPSDEAEVVVLHRVDGLGQVEIARMMQSSERTVRRLLVRFDERVESLRKECI